MDRKKIKFLLDENIDFRIIPIFKELGFSCSTVRDQGWSGFKNGELSILVKKNNYILITRDRDFTFLYSKYDIQVIYLEIHPPMPRIIINELKILFENFDVDVSKSFLIKIKKGEAIINYR